MPELDDFIRGTQVREYVVDLHTRAASDGEQEAREIEGIGVPWGEVANIGGIFTESVERGAVDDEGALIYFRHRDPIGKLVAAEDVDSGRKIRGKISETTSGNDAMVLARDGVLSKLSMGFEPIEYTTREDEDGSVHITHTKIKVREYSLVPLPAYEGADLINVREKAANTKGTNMPEEIKPFSHEDGVEVREAVEDLTRRLEAGAFHAAEPEPVDTRSAAQVLKAIVSGDSATIEQYNAMQERAYEGGTTADAVNKPAWVGDLTRIINEAAPLLDVFESGALPQTGNHIEFGELKANTVEVEEQENEGDDLVYGGVSIKTRTAEVKTVGGWGELSRQTIERSTVGILNTLLTAQSIAAGKQTNAQMRAAFTKVAGEQRTAGNVVELPSAGVDYADWIDGIVDAAVLFERLGLPITGLVTNTVVFKALGRLTASDGRPVLLVRGDGNNNVGEFNPVGLAGNLAGVTVRLDAGLSSGSALAAFVNSKAIRAYLSPVARLQDENIINLTKQFSIYRYTAMAEEIPQAVVPVNFTGTPE